MIGVPSYDGVELDADEDDDEVFAELKVAGKEATDLRYEAELAPHG